MVAPNPNPVSSDERRYACILTITHSDSINQCRQKEGLTDEGPGLMTDSV